MSSEARAWLNVGSAFAFSMAILICACCGCSGPDPAKKAGLEDEIADLTSMALCPGPRTPAQTQRIADDGAKARAHVEELVK